MGRGRGRGRGGHNRQRFTQRVRQFWSPRNAWELDAAGVDDLTPALWKLRCGCHVHKSRHAVSNSLRRAAESGCPRHPACFECPRHGAGRRSASFPTRRAFAVLCDIAATLERTCTVVWEGRPIAGLPAFDFWLLELRIVVEVDGAQHTEGSHHGTSAEEQALRDAAKNREAIRAGYHVVRLHVGDDWCWAGVVSGAIAAAACGPLVCPPQLHRSPFYPILLPE